MPLDTKAPEPRKIVDYECFGSDGNANTWVVSGEWSKADGKGKVRCILRTDAEKQIYDKTYDGSDE